MTDTNNVEQQVQYDNELRGALFHNNKGGNPKRPDFRGRCTIEGTDYRISAWQRRAVQSGQTYLSMAFTVEEPKATEESPVTDSDFTPAKTEVTSSPDDSMF